MNRPVQFLRADPAEEGGSRNAEAGSAHGQTEVANLLIRQPLRPSQQLLQLEWASLTARMARCGSVPLEHLQTRALMPLPPLIKFPVVELDLWLD